MSKAHQPSYTVKLFLSADPEPGVEATKRAVLDRITDLVDRGVIERYEVHVWGKAFRPDGPLDGTRYQRWVAGHLDDFREWAADNDASLAPAFCEQHVECPLSGESYDVVSLPRVCLALYRDGDLWSLAPTRDAGGVRSPRDALDDLSTRRSSPPNAT